MDGFLLVTLYNNQKKSNIKDEEYKELEKTIYTVDNQTTNTGSVLTLIVFFIAAYLSWNCNSICTPNMSTIEKVVRAFLAGTFGWLYIIIYFLIYNYIFIYLYKIIFNFLYKNINKFNKYIFIKFLILLFIISSSDISIN